MSYLIFIILLISIIPVMTILSFKNKKKKYLPVKNYNMSIEQELYIVENLLKLGKNNFHQNINLAETVKIIEKIDEGKLSIKEIERINTILLNQTFNIGMIQFK